MLIYCPQNSPRLEYVNSLIFSELLNVDWRLTTDRDEFDHADGAKWAYSNDATISALRLPCVPLLFEDDVHEQNLAPAEWNNFKLFFPVPENPFFPFDALALTFYLVSRYEEYLPDIQQDAHGRYDIRQAISYRNYFHRTPIINLIANEFATILQRHFPDFQWKKLPFTPIYTCDVDVAFQYHGKGIWRWSANLMKSLYRLDFQEVKKFVRAAFGRQVADSYTDYDRYKKLPKDYKNRPIFFIPTANFGKYDKNTRWKSKHLQQLLQNLAQHAEIGLHPSYASFENPKLLATEKARLEQICGGAILKSRQHYLRFRFPETPNSLIINNIEEDYTLGWANEVGFRASIAAPFRFFDLQKNGTTNLVFHPLAVMDVALGRVCLSRTESLSLLREVEETVRQCGGEFVILNHNSEPFIFS